MPRIWDMAISEAYDMTEVPIKPAAKPLNSLASKKCHQVVEKISVMIVWARGGER